MAAPLSVACVVNWQAAAAWRWLIIADRTLRYAPSCDDYVVNDDSDASKAAFTPAAVQILNLCLEI